MAEDEPDSNLNNYLIDGTQAIDSVPRSRLYMSKIFSDFTIVVKENECTHKFPAHKDVVVPRSPFFRSLLEEERHASASNPEIEIDYCGPEVMRIVLRYMYTKKLFLNNWKQALEVHLLAERFEMPELRRLCFSFLETQITLQNVCSIFRRSSDLQYACLEVIQTAAVIILQSEDFLFLPLECVEKIVSLEKMNIECEEEIFFAIWNWGEAKCKREHEDYTDDMIVEQIAPLLKHVRFKIIESNVRKELLDMVCGCNFEDNEFSTPREKDMYSFTMLKLAREIPLLEPNVRFDDPIKVTGNVIASIIFSVSDPLFLTGFKVKFGFADKIPRWDMPFESSVTIESEDNNLIDCQTHTDEEMMPPTVCKDGSIAENVETSIVFVFPVLLTPKQIYSVHLTLDKLIQNGKAVCQKPKLPTRYATSPMSTGVGARIYFESAVIEGFVAMYFVPVIKQRSSRVRACSVRNSRISETDGQVYQCFV